MTGFLVRHMRRFANTLRWSLEGWRAAWASEVSLRQWVLANAVSGTLALALPIDTGARAAILGLGVMVLAAELFNTAIEETVDHISTERSPRAATIKNCASAAVALCAVAVGVAWAVALWDLA